MNKEKLKEIRLAAEQDLDYVRALRRDFHQHPEIAFQEHRTSDRIEEELRKLDIDCFRVSETGVIGILHGNQPGKAEIALRADIDALPMSEDNVVGYRSLEPGRMHACGHDVHTAALLGAAKLLAARRHELSGTVRFLFQPAEEIGAGAKRFCREDAREKTLGSAQRVFGIHTAPDLHTGVLGVKPGINNASVDHFTIRIRGKASHVCKPNEGVDALYIGSQIVVAVQALVTRMSSPVEPLIIGIGKFTAGDSYNIVAEEAVLEGTTRNISAENRKRINALVTKAAESTAALYGGTVETLWEDFALPLVNPPETTREVQDVLAELVGREQICTDRELYLSGDDFSDYQAEIPGVYVYLGTGNPEVPGTENAYHTSHFNVDEAAIPIGSAAYAAYAYWWLTEGYAADQHC